MSEKTQTPIFEYSAPIAPIMPNEAKLLAKNFNCADPEQKTFVGLPPSVKNERNLPSGLPISLMVRANGETRTLQAYVAGGRGGLLRLSLDLIDLLQVAPNAQATISMTLDASGAPAFALAAV